MHVRIATELDRDDVHSVHWSAFAEDEREIVSKLAVDLLSEETTPQTISLVAETDGVVVGHVAFSPVTIASNENVHGYILAPLGVRPDYKKHRIAAPNYNCIYACCLMFIRQALPGFLWELS